MSAPEASEQGLLPKLQSPSIEYIKRRRNLHQRQQSMSGSLVMSSTSSLPATSRTPNFDPADAQRPERVASHRQSAYVPYNKDWLEGEDDDIDKVVSGASWPSADLASDIPASARGTPYAAQFAALDSALRLDKDMDDCDGFKSPVPSPDAKAQIESASTSNSHLGSVPTRRVKASARLGDNVVEFRPGNRFVKFDTLNVQLRSVRCKHCLQTGGLMIEPPPEERRGFFIIVAALLPMFASMFASRLKLRCSRCQSSSWARFYIEEIDQLKTTVDVN